MTHACSLEGCDITALTYAFRDPGTHITPTTAVCRYCKDGARLVVGDGEPLVCRDCIRMCVRFTQQPEVIGPEVLESLLTVHGDVVRLERVNGGTLRWSWSPTWPQHA